MRKELNPFSLVVWCLQTETSNGASQQSSGMPFVGSKRLQWSVSGTGFSQQREYEANECGFDLGHGVTANTLTSMRASLG